MKKIIVIGAGFVGINFIDKIAKYRDKYEIVLFDKNNHHTFQPMLYQAATGFIPLNNVVSPIRELIKKPNVKFNMQEVIDIVPDEKIVKTKEQNYSYDYLIVATGVQYDYFGNDDWQKYILSLKTAYDAQRIKSHMLEQFELAETSKTIEQRDKHLSFIIIGAGATGVEIAGAILDLIRTDCFKTYKNFNISDVKLHLIEGGSSILSAFDKKLSNHAHKSLEARGVNIHLNEMVTNIESGTVYSKGSVYKGETIIWSTILKAKGIGSWMDSQISNGKIEVLGNLMHKDYDNVFFAGDVSCVRDNPLPGLAAVAKQQGKYLAKTIVRKDKGQNVKKFKYKDLGAMAIIKKHEAVADIFGMKFKGKLGWFIWGGVHITFLISFRNKFVVALSWLSYYIFKRVGSVAAISSKNISRKQNDCVK